MSTKYEGASEVRTNNEVRTKYEHTKYEGVSEVRTIYEHTNFIVSSIFRWVNDKIHTFDNNYIFQVGGF